MNQVVPWVELTLDVVLTKALVLAVDLRDPM